MSLRVTNRKGAWMRRLFGLLSGLGTFYALGSEWIAVGDVATIAATTPICVAILAGPMLHERVPRSVKYGIALGFAGVVVLLQPSFGTAAPIALLACAGVRVCVCVRHHLAAPHERKRDQREHRV